MTPFEIAIPFIVLAVVTVLVVVYIIRSAMKESGGREARAAAGQRSKEEAGERG